MSETYAGQLMRVRLIAEGHEGWERELEDGDIKALLAVLARLNSLEDALGEKQHISCTYCGHKVFMRGLTPEQAQQQINDHIFACDKRPEAGLLLVVGGILNAFGVDVDSIPKEAGRDGVLEAAVDAAGNLLDELDELRKDKARLDKIEAHLSTNRTLWPRIGIQVEDSYLEVGGTRAEIGEPAKAGSWSHVAKTFRECVDAMEGKP